MISLQDKVIVVVGGSSGIGWATAVMAAELGAAVTVADVAPLPAEQAGVGHVVCDATSPDSIEETVASVLQHSGRLDGVVTTVGGAHVGELAELDLAAWDAELRFNLTTVFLVCRAVLPHLEAQGAGAIVAFSSSFGVLPGPDRPAYAAAKAGVIGLSRSLAAAAAPSGVRVNCIAPGPTDTPRFRAMNGEEGVAYWRSQVPLGRIPVPEDCARVAAFLLSDAGQNITGQVLHVNAGLFMS